MTYISWSSDFDCYLQHYLMDLYHTWYRILVQYDTMGDLIILVGHYDL